MSTIESPVVDQLVHDIMSTGAQHKKDERFSGSVGNQAHQMKLSYHNSFEDMLRKFGRDLGKYSMSLWGDTHVPKANRRDAAAIDMSSTQHSDLVQVVARMHHMAVTNPKVLTAMGVREFAGPDVNGGVYAMSERKRPGRSSIFVRTYGWDSSHEAHVHISLNRRFTRNPVIRRIAIFWRGL